MHRGGAPGVERRARFPRTRGDAPDTAISSYPRNQLPPHTRGCTREFLAPREAVIASPAHAGMHLIQAELIFRSPGFPRTRGDAPPPLLDLLLEVMLPPHTRGCTRRGFDDYAARDASPAHAGMHPQGAVNARAARGFPRTRGDAPRRGPARRRWPRLPPHTRGCTLIGVGCRVGRPASPAHAGMHPKYRNRASGVSGFPRTRGDAPDRRRAAQRPPALPPHTRGCTRLGAGFRPCFLASPAHAGMHLLAPPAAPTIASFPRTRGDAPNPPPPRTTSPPLPPHTRGCTLEAALKRYVPVASPAHAGMHPV